MKKLLILNPGNRFDIWLFLALFILGVGLLTAQEPVISNDTTLSISSVDLALKLDKISEAIIPDLGEAKWKLLRLSLVEDPMDEIDRKKPLLFELAPTYLKLEGKKRRGEIVLAPIPGSSPTFGWTLTMMGGYIYQPFLISTTSPPWVTGGGLLYTGNETRGWAVLHKMNLDDDQWRFIIAGGQGIVKYDFYGVGILTERTYSIPLEVQFSGGYLEGLYEVRPNLYAGLAYIAGRTKTVVRLSDLINLPNFSIPDIELDAVISGPSLRLQYDTRDNQFYPSKGSLADLEATFYMESLGSDFSYQALSLNYNYYWGITDRQILAFRGAGRFTFGDTPFFGLSYFGSKNDLRGYPVGRYQDRMLLAGQVEHRLKLTERWGWVTFGGVGAVAPQIDEFIDADLLPSIGFGIRYLLAKNNKVNFRADIAWGKDDSAVYLGVGEAF